MLGARARAAGLALLVATLWSRAVLAAPDGDGGRKSMRAARAATPPRIDGLLDDAAWAAAEPDDRFTQVFPNDGRPPSERTEVRVLYDDDAIYVGVRLLDDHPAEIATQLTRRDRIPEADAVSVSFDSQHDHTTAYVFRLHASGVQYDALSYDDGAGSAPEWDAVWTGEVSVDARGWTAELRIPLAALRFAGLGEETWGVQVMRYVSRTGERDVWSYWPLSVPGEASHYDHLTGLVGLRPRSAWALQPYVLGRLRGQTPLGTSFLGGSAGTGGTRIYDGGAGLDLKAPLSPALTFNLTVNPDFGQVEADQVVLNLTRYETFFPEKRPFFLEGTDIFRTPLQLFYSRRIGKPPSGLQVGQTFTPDPTPGAPVLTVSDAPSALRIWTAGKLSGKVGRDLSVGALGALTDTESVTAKDATGASQDVRLAPLRAFGVARARYALGGPSYLGVMATSVTRLDGHLFRAIDDHDAYAASADGQWQSSSAAWRISGQGLATERWGGTSAAYANGTPCPDPTIAGCVPIVRTDGTRLYPGARGYGGTLRLTHTGTHVIEDVSGDVLSPALDPNDAGYLPDFNKRDGAARLGYQETHPGDTFQSYVLSLSQSAAWDFSGVRVGTRTAVDWSSLFRSFAVLNLDVGYEWPDGWDTRETLDGARFERPPRVDASIYASTDARKAVSADLSLSYGRAVGAGTFTYAPNAAYSYSIASSVNLRPLSRIELTLAAGLGLSGRDIRFYSCNGAPGAICSVDTDARQYVFGALDSGSLSFVGRTTIALTPTLSFQAYAQLFFARGAFSDFRMVDTTGPAPFIHRSDLGLSTFNDTSADFEQVAVDGNAVLRWEPLPGSAVYLVYTRSQAGSPTLNGMTPGFYTRGLAQTGTNDVLLLKLVLYFGP